MRPRRKVLLWSWDKEPAPSYDCKFVLETMLRVKVWRWRVGIEELRRAVREREWDLVIVQHAGKRDATARAIRAARSVGVPALVVGAEKDQPLAFGVAELRKDATAVELLDSVARLSRKKRGPKPQPALHEPLRRTA